MYSASGLACRAIASNLDTLAILFPNASLHAFTVANPIRTPVNDPGPEATANTSTSSIPNPEDLRAPSAVGRTQDEYSVAPSCATSVNTSSSRRTAKLPLESHVSSARRITSAFYSTTPPLSDFALTLAYNHG